MTDSEIDRDEIERMVERLYREIQRPEGETERSLRNSYGDNLYERKQLEAGLAVLSKEMAEHLAVSPQEGAQPFFDSYTSAINRVMANYERKKVRRPIDETGLSTGIVEKVSQGQSRSRHYTKRGLSSNEFAKEISNPELVHEWTTKPGEYLTDELAERFNDTICGDVYEAYQEQRFGKVDLPVLIATNVLSDGFAPDSFWVPVSVCFSMIVAQRGLDQFCEE